ncbi:hypothetical protein [Vreelandella sp.]|uniref:hypothetical protein n=1 Tax=Vreelandella sp. TaxID=3137778 RepID=UPI003BAD47D1
MQPKLLSTHIKILETANATPGWVDLDVGAFNIIHHEVVACCKELDDWGLIEYNDGSTQLGTSVKQPVFTPATTKPEIAITANGIRALSEINS